MWHYRVIIFTVVLKSIKDYTRFNDFCFLSFQLFYLIGPFILVYTEKYIPESKESKMKSLPFILLFLLLTLPACTGKIVKRLYESIPKQMEKWEAKDADELYHRNILYEYINGGAELYLNYDFKQVFVRRYIGPADAEIILEIYDMGTFSDAFGIFSVEREDEEIGIGQGSEYGGGLLRFWKGRFFVSILTSADEQIARSAMIKLAQEIDNLIISSELKPDLLKALPPEGLQAKSLRFFHTAAILNRQYFLAEQNILQLNKQTDCLLAKYRCDDDSAYLLLIEYQNQKQAKNAYYTFIESYMPEAKGSGVAQMENNTWTMINENKNYLILALEASQKDVGINLMARVKLAKE